jgi:hypothetical protein
MVWCHSNVEVVSEMDYCSTTKEGKKKEKKITLRAKTLLEPQSMTWCDTVATWRLKKKEKKKHQYST